MKEKALSAREKLLVILQYFDLRQVAKQLGVSHSTVSKWEHGKHQVRPKYLTGIDLLYKSVTNRDYVSLLLNTLLRTEQDVEVLAGGTRYVFNAGGAFVEVNEHLIAFDYIQQTANELIFFKNATEVAKKAKIN